MRQQIYNRGGELHQMKTNYNKTLQACFVGYVVQAIVNNFVPLLFLTFQSSYGISLQKITLLVTFNFGIQLLVDLASIGFVDRIGYRVSMIIAHGMAAAGLILLTVLPEVFADPFWGLLVAVMIYGLTNITEVKQTDYSLATVKEIGNYKNFSLLPFCCDACSILNAGKGRAVPVIASEL